MLRAHWPQRCAASLLPALAALAHAGDTPDPLKHSTSPTGCALPFGALHWSTRHIFVAHGVGCGIPGMAAIWPQDWPTAFTKPMDVWSAEPPPGVHIPNPRTGTSPAHMILGGGAHPTWGGEMAVSYRSGIMRARVFGLRKGATSRQGYLAIGSNALRELRLDGATVWGTSVQSGFAGSKQAEAKLHFCLLLDREPDEVKRYDVALEFKGKPTGGTTPALCLRFDCSQDDDFMVKLGISWASQANARANIQAEIPDWDFDRVRDAGARIWREHLLRVCPEGAPEWLERHLYWNLHRVSLHPDLYTDANGEFLGFDDKTSRVEDGSARYHLFSSWDTWRHHMPLVSFIYPEVGSCIARSFIDQARTGRGGFARWSIANRETGVMEGDPSCTMIGAAYATGARDFDVNAALDIMQRCATEPDLQSSPGFLTRPGLRRYLATGIADHRYDKDHGLSGSGGGMHSQTLEYSISDFAIHRLALAAGRKELAERMLRQSQHWKAVVDPRTRTFPEKGGYSEGYWWSYQFLVPHNMAGLAKLLGGAERASKILDDHYPHPGNECTHHSPWAHNWFGAPWKTQRLTRTMFIKDFCIPKGVSHWDWKWKAGEPVDAAKLTPKLPGADDLGAMTSMAFWLAVGLCAYIPGVDGFAVGSPLVPKLVIRRGDKGTLTIIAHNAALDAPYVRGLKVNGKEHNSCWIPFRLLDRKDNVLEFTMDKEPNKAWGLDPPPPSFDAEPWYLSARQMKEGGR